MTLKEKRQQEADLLKHSRIARILDASKALFAENGIDAVTMDDIAEASETGVASLYRYFKTKEELAVQCVARAWSLRAAYFTAKFNTDAYRTKTGLEQIEQILSVFIMQFQEDQSFYRLICNFDSFIQRKGVTCAQLSEYEAQILAVKCIVTDALRRGASDGSILAGYAEDALYYTVMHSMFSLAQKLSLSGDMLESDRTVPPEEQLRILAGLLIKSLRK